MTRKISGHAALTQGGRVMEGARSRARGILKKYNRAPDPCALVLIDCSGSMCGEPLEQARRGALDFAKAAQARGYSVGLVSFSSSAGVVHEPRRPGEMLERSILSLVAGGSTNMVAALEQGMMATPRLARPKSLVLVTDGHPDNPDATLRKAADAARSGFEILAIGTETADHSFLKRLVTRPGTDLRVSSSELSSGMRQIAALLPEPIAPTGRDPTPEE
jgi:Mg-chelatase subunit ChlD